MGKNRKRKKRHFIFDVAENQPVTVYDIFSRLEMELRVYPNNKSGFSIDFLLPGSVRIARGHLR